MARKRYSYEDVLKVLREFTITITTFGLSSSNNDKVAGSEKNR